MSVINKMLQDLDRRHAIGTVSGAFSARQVRAVASTPGHEWFWRVVALLTLLALAWAGWVAYQLRPPRALVTPRAEQAVANIRPGPLSASSAVPTPTANPIPLPPAPPLAVPGRPRLTPFALVGTQCRTCRTFARVGLIDRSDPIKTRCVQRSDTPQSIRRMALA